MTVDEVKGFGRQGGHTEIYRGAEYTVDFVPKVKVETSSSTSRAERVVDDIVARPAPGRSATARSGSPTSTSVVRIRTGELGDDAV